MMPPDPRTPPEALLAADGGEDAVIHCQHCGRLVLAEADRETVIYPGRMPCARCLGAAEGDDS